MGWSIFVGCMFIGLGVGMIFDNAGAGVIIGMGVGFILESILGAAKSRSLGVVIESRPRPSAVTVVMIAIGLAFILLGLSMMGYIPISWTTIGGCFFLVLGLAAIVYGIAKLVRR